MQRGVPARGAGACMVGAAPAAFANDSKASLDREISNAKTFVLGNQNGLKEIVGQQGICLRITLLYGDVLVTVDVHRPLRSRKSLWLSAGSLTKPQRPLRGGVERASACGCPCVVVVPR